MTSVTPVINIVSSNPPPSEQQTSTKPRPATTRPGPALVPPELLDISADALGSLVQHIAALTRGQSIADVDQSESATHSVDTSSPSETAEWPDRTPLTPGQEMHIDHLLSVESDSLTRELLIGMKREGMPTEAFVSDFVSQFAEWGWDDLKSALALKALEDVRNSDWDEWLAHADSAPVETTAQDLGNDWIEGLLIIDANSGQTLLSRTGVVRADGTQYVGLQDYEAEALKGRDLIFVHNHPNGTEASDEDLDSAYAAGAELLIVITAQGQEFV